MRRNERACPDCGSPARGNPCWWNLDHPDYAQTGGDLPCSDYAYTRDAMARERRFGQRWFWATVICIVILIALIAAARAQEHHARHHAFYQNWVNKAEKGCCNNQDCGELRAEDERQSGDRVEVRIDGEWCAVQPFHYLKRGNAPDWSTAHVCIQNDKAASGKACDRLLCYQPKPGS